jgi:hypothetical protein
MKKIAIFGCKTTTRFILEALVEKHKTSQLITIRGVQSDNKYAEAFEVIRLIIK